MGGVEVGVGHSESGLKSAHTPPTTSPHCAVQWGAASHTAGPTTTRRWESYVSCLRETLCGQATERRGPQGPESGFHSSTVTPGHVSCRLTEHSATSAAHNPTTTNPRLLGQPLKTCDDAVWTAPGTKGDQLHHPPPAQSATPPLSPRLLHGPRTPPPTEGATLRTQGRPPSVGGSGEISPSVGARVKSHLQVGAGLPELRSCESGGGGHGLPVPNTP